MGGAVGQCHGVGALRPPLGSSRCSNRRKRAALSLLTSEERQQEVCAQIDEVDKKVAQAVKGGERVQQ